MPQKSMAINLCRVFINIQSKADNIDDKLLLSFVAHKAFDSIEWTTGHIFGPSCKNLDLGRTLFHGSSSCIVPLGPPLERQDGCLQTSACLGAPDRNVHCLHSFLLWPKSC